VSIKTLHITHGAAVVDVVQKVEEIVETIALEGLNRTHSRTQQARV